MANEQNLKPIRDSKRARELQEKAAEKQRENRAKLKTFKAMLQSMLDEVDPKTGKTNRELVNDALMQQARKGNIKAYEVMRDTSGEIIKNISSVDVTTENRELKRLTDDELKALIKKTLK